MHHVWMPVHWLIALLLTVLGLTTRPVLAHERREVGAYQLVVGFLTEPAFEGLDQRGHPCKNLRFCPTRKPETDLTTGR